VLVFVFNDQNLDGIARIATEIAGKNAVFELTKRQPEVLFLPSRKDVSEIGQLREWEAKAVALFDPFFVSPRIIDRFGDSGLDYLRAASVPYVPYFAFGEELAATTDKGYEMTAALEVLAEMLSDSAPLPRKRRPSQPYTMSGKPPPRREPSFSGRRFTSEGQEAQGAAAPPGNELPLDNKSLGAGSELERERERWSSDRRAKRRWVGATLVALVGVTALGIGSIFDWDFHALTDDDAETEPGIQLPSNASETGSDETSDATTGTQMLDLGLLRAVVRFEFLTIYPRDQPAPRVFDGSLQCEFAFGSTPGASGWTRTWKLQDVEQELRASVIEDLQLVANVQSVAYKGFQANTEPAQEFSLEHVAGQEVEARLVGPGASPGWLTEAWARAEAQGIEQLRLTKSFRKFYGVAADEPLLVDVTPVVATMQIEYDGRPFASLIGWVARDPATRDLVVNFAPAEVLDPSESSPPPLAGSIAPYLARRDEQQKWLAAIQGVGSYGEKGGKLVYQLGIAVPTTEVGDIQRVTYRFGDGSTLAANKPGLSNDWGVTTVRKTCEGTVSIEVQLHSGVALPLSFDWCQDAVRIDPRGEPPDPSQGPHSSCNMNLVAKNPHVAQKICAEEYEAATNPEEKARLLDSLIAAHASYGDDGDYCQYLSEAEMMGDEEAKAELEAVRTRCAAAAASRQQEDAEQKKPHPRGSAPR
jgi:hypothetical protein